MDAGTDQTTDHLSGAEIQRYTMQLVDHWPVDPAEEAWTELREEAHPGGRYVKHTDHLATIAAAEDKGRSEERERLLGKVQGPSAAAVAIRAYEESSTVKCETRPMLNAVAAVASAALDSDQVAR